jgi:hypothetical protein
VGLFPHTIGKRFSCARTGASWGPIRGPVRARELEEGRCPGKTVQVLASLSDTARCGVDRYAFHGTLEAGIPSLGLAHAGCGMLDPSFRELPFHALGWIGLRWGRRPLGGGIMAVDDVQPTEISREEEGI